MNYRIVAIEDLRRYYDLCAGAEAATERIAKLSEQSGRREVAGNENALIDNIVERDRLRWNIESTKPIREGVTHALHALEEEDQLLLQKFYLEGERAPVSELSIQLHCAPHEVFQRRDRALRRLTLRMYGIEEL